MQRYKRSFKNVPVPLGFTLQHRRRNLAFAMERGGIRGSYMAKYIGAIDQGTTSTRFILFDDRGRIVSIAQKEREQIYPRPGWVEHSPEEIWQRTVEVIGQALQQAGMEDRKRESMYRSWKKAVRRTFDWVDEP